MPSKKKRLPVYLTDEEHAAISASAAKAGISLSTFAKRVCTGMPVPSLEHKQAVQDIIKARADLGRLGGLLEVVDVFGQQPACFNALISGLFQADDGIRPDDQQLLPAHEAIGEAPGLFAVRRDVEKQAVTVRNFLNLAIAFSRFHKGV